MLAETPAAGVGNSDSNGWGTVVRLDSRRTLAREIPVVIDRASVQSGRQR